MKSFFRIASIVCLLGFSFLIFTSPSQGQPWYPPYSQAPYSQYSPYSQSPYYSPYSSPPINININMGEFPGGSSMGYNPIPRAICHIHRRPPVVQAIFLPSFT